LYCGRHNFTGIFSTHPLPKKIRENLQGIHKACPANSVTARWNFEEQMKFLFPKNLRFSELGSVQFLAFLLIFSG
jgi:hypothetical protein